MVEQCFKFIKKSGWSGSIRNYEKLYVFHYETMLLFKVFSGYV